MIGGPGAFVLTADADARFAEAIVRKLILEIAERPAETAPCRPADEVRAPARVPARVGS